MGCSQVATAASGKTVLCAHRLHEHTDGSAMLLQRGMSITRVGFTLLASDLDNLDRPTVVGGACRPEQFHIDAHPHSDACPLVGVSRARVVLAHSVRCAIEGCNTTRESTWRGRASSPGSVISKF